MKIFIPLFLLCILSACEPACQTQEECQKLQKEENEK